MAHDNAYFKQLITKLNLHLTLIRTAHAVAFRSAFRIPHSGIPHKGSLADSEFPQTRSRSRKPARLV
jgi:hypothetical protein